jgi:TonB family protein
MKTLNTILLLIAITASPAPAQKDSVYAYYDLAWKKVHDKRDAKYFRVANKRPDGKYLVRDYYMPGKLQFAGVCTALDPKLNIEGDGTLYYEDGGVREVGHFRDEQPEGLHKYYYEDGSPYKVMFYREGKKPVYHHFWSRTGEEKLVKGKGLAVDNFAGLPDHYNEIEDSVVVAAFADDAEIHAAVYTMADQQPEYLGGYTQLVQDIRATMKYPKSARKKGIEGTVYVSFVVDTLGNALPGRVIKGIDEECDAEAMRAVSTLKKWEPGRHKGKPVFVRFVLPIKFSLKGWSLW